MAKLFNTLKANYPLVCILLLSSFLRIYHADYQSLWIDEINTMIQSDPSQSFTQTYTSLLTLDLQPPLFFYILKYLFCIFGYTTLVLRLFSAALGIAAVFGIYLLGKELFNKKAGLYSSLILAINYFHIYYSQEARPYAFLLLFTVLAFYFLVRFIKAPSYKNAIFYGAMASFMLYGHPCGLFSLFAQFLILLTCFFQINDGTKWLFFKQAFIAGLVTIVLYLPALPPLMSAAGINNFWIPAPTPDVYTNILAEFFGKSEMVLSIIYIIAIFFFIQVFTTKNNTGLLEGIRSNKLTSAFILIMAWLVTGLLIPLIRSYLQVPMIIPRYLIGLLPAVILIVAIGLSEINQRAIRLLFALLILLFSITDLFVVKDYYNKVVKSQLREIGDFINENNDGSVPVISNLWWHYSVYLDTNKYNILKINPSDFINDLKAHPEKIKPFWYINGHQFFFKSLPEEQKQFLNDRFYIAQKLDLVDAWSIYFIPKNETNQLRIDLNEFQPLNSGIGNYIFLYNNVSTRSKPFKLSEGDYTLYVEGQSEPEEPINKIDAHVTIKLNDRTIGGTFLPSKKFPGLKKINFHISKSEEVAIEIIFDNDLNLNNKDRNALIYSLRIEKK